ncbi:hypothetical protein GCM10020220_045230 [Nonomuraea rubra]|uniref:Gfo/Idh/MocA family protein n=1 Tax=Nonomuraea rubra TaxID=46180 RepID=UPI0031E82F29
MWCEKPAALSLAELDRMAAAEGAGGPYLSVVYQQRFGSGAGHLRALGGALGRPMLALCQTTWHRGEEYYSVPYRGKWATEGGGTTVLHGVHQMDLMLSVFGDWAEVRAMAGRLDRPIETEDVSLAMVRFENGAMGSVVTSVLSPREESYLRFDFADATVELRHLYGYGNADWTSTSPLWSPPEDVPQQPRHPARPAAGTPTSAASARRPRARTPGGPWSSSPACTPPPSPAARCCGRRSPRTARSTTGSTAALKRSSPPVSPEPEGAPGPPPKHPR